MSENLGEQAVFFGGATSSGLASPLVGTLELATFLSISHALATMLLASEVIPGVRIGRRRYALAKPLIEAKAKGELLVKIKLGGKK